MTEKKPKLSPAEYEKRRKEADRKNQEIRKKIAEKEGKAALKGLHVDDIIPIRKGGHPTDLKNKQLIPAKKNLEKGTKLPKK